MRKGFMAMALAPMLAGCMATPLNSPVHTASALLKANFVNSSNYQTQAVQTTYTQNDVFHLKIELWKGGSKVATKEVLNDDLGAPITVKNLLVNTDYQVRCFAFQTADESAPISLDDATSHTDIHVATNDAATVNPIKVKLIDTIFGAEGSNSIAVTDGVFLPVAPESF